MLIRLLKYILRILAGTLLGLYVLLLILVDTPWVQRRLSTLAAQELSQLLQTEVSINAIQLGLFNRIVLKDVVLKDQSSQQLLHVTRLAAQFEIAPLLQQRIVVNSLQLYDFEADLYQENPHTTPNYQFLLDALASKDTVQTNTPLNLRLNTVLVRRGDLSYHVASAPHTPDQFNPQHIAITNLFATLSIKALQSDSINASIRRLSFDEQSGFSLQKLSTKLIANKQQLQVSRLSVELPHTQVNIDSLIARYDSLPNLFQLTPTTTYQASINGHLVLADVAPFVPQLSHFQSPIQLHINAAGVGKSIHCSLLHLSTYEGLSLKAKGQLTQWDQPEHAKLSGEISEFSLTKEGAQSLFANLDQPLPPPVARMGEIYFHGNATGLLNQLSLHGLLQTDAGAIMGEMRLEKNHEGKNSYSGQITAHELDMGHLLGQPEQMGNASFELSLNGCNYQQEYPEAALKGVINSFEYNHYTYQNITLEGLLKQGGFSGSIALHDPNGTIQLEGKIQNRQAIPNYQLTLAVKEFCPDRLNLSDNHPDMEFSFNLASQFRGNSIDNLVGQLSIDSLLVRQANAPYYAMQQLTLQASQEGDKKEIRIESPFMKGRITGNYNYTTLPQSILETLGNYLPALIEQPRAKRTVQSNSTSQSNTTQSNATIERPQRGAGSNDIDLDLQISSTEILSKLLNLPVELHTPAHLSGYFYESQQQVAIKAYLPQFTYAKTRYESSTLLIDNLSNQVSCNLRSSILLKSGAMLNLSLQAAGKENQLHTVINWWNNTQNTYGGKVMANASFQKEEKKRAPLKSQIEILPSQIVLNDTTWNLHPSHITIDSSRIAINNFLLEHQEQYLRINGKLTPNSTDTCSIQLNKINVGYVLDLVQFRDVAFDGYASGKVTLTQKEGKPDMRTELKVANFSMNKSLLGDAHIKAFWDNKPGDIVIQADIAEKNLSTTRVRGYVSPVRQKLDLRIAADRTHLGLITPFVEGIVSEIDGRVSGNIRLFGPLKELDLEGAVEANLDTKIDVLNTYFQIRQDSVRLQSGQITFDNILLLDRQGQSGRLTGGLYHNKLKELRYNFQVTPQNMLLYNTTTPDDLPFYGKVYATGRVQIAGGEEGMEVTANLRTEPHTDFTYSEGVITEATNSQFITFQDKTPQRIQDQIETELYHPLNAKQQQQQTGTPLDLRINLMVEATPSATMRVITDPLSGDNITATGSGNIQVNFHSKGDLRMFGNYTIQSGVYKLSIQEIIRKDFILNPGGTIRFTGDPYYANLNLQAAYAVNSASLRDLGMGIQTTQGGQSSIRVNCLMNLTGNLANPNIKFDLELPTVSNEDRELIRSVTQTEEQMNTQIIYLLTIGKFYAFDYANSGQSSNATSSLAFSTLSGQLNNMLSSLLENKNWDVGANFSTGEKGWSDVEAQAMLSGRLFNDRLLLNGQFGYRENTVTNNNFMGDFEAIYLLEKRGEWRLKGYSKTNERFYMKSTLTTQGIGVMYKKDFDEWSTLFNWIPWRKREKKK
ncbi:MAG: translocation/assembly module TamB domain-containing protein [Phocaeicola sp.]